MRDEYFPSSDRTTGRPTTLGHIERSVKGSFLLLAEIFTNIKRSFHHDDLNTRHCFTLIIKRNSSLILDFFKRMVERN